MRCSFHFERLLFFYGIYTLVDKMVWWSTSFKMKIYPPLHLKRYSFLNRSTNDFGLNFPGESKLWPWFQDRQCIAFWWSWYWLENWNYRQCLILTEYLGLCLQLLFISLLLLLLLIKWCWNGWRHGVTLGLDNASVAPSTIVFTTDAWQRLAE